MDVLRKERGDAGQATVELAVVLPVAIVLAVIVVNALSFFEACAAFDQLARQAICAYAPSPEAGQGPAEVAALVESELEEALGTSNLAIEVTVQGRAGSYQRYCGRLSFAPTLFGLGLKDEVFGVSLPRLVHEVDLTVDAYRPGCCSDGCREDMAPSIRVCPRACPGPPARSGFGATDGGGHAARGARGA